MNRNLRINNLCVIIALEFIMILMIWRLIHEANGAQVYFTVNAQPTHSSDDFGTTIFIATNNVMMVLSRWIINNLFKKYIIN